MKNPYTKRNRKREGVLRAVLEQPTLEMAAYAAEMSMASLHRIVTKPEFQHDLAEARKRRQSQAMSNLQFASPKAIEILLEIMSDPDASASSRIRAIEIVLSESKDALIADFEARLKRLEEARARAAKESARGQKDKL